MGLKDKGIPEEMWAAYQGQWKIPEKRAQVQSRLTWTPEFLAKQQAAFGFTFLAKSQKLDRLVDEKLATEDQQFNTTLQHWNNNHGLPWLSNSTWNSGARRSERISKMHIVLSDPSVATRCEVPTATK
jgi:hypothetical protein